MNIKIISSFLASFFGLSSLTMAENIETNDVLIYN